MKTNANKGREIQRDYIAWYGVKNIEMISYTLKSLLISELLVTLTFIKYLNSSLLMVELANEME